MSSALKVPALAFIATWLLHTADHIRRGLETTSEGVTWAGTVAAILAAIALTLIFTRHVSAAFVSAAVFPALAFGVAATHLAPEWGYFSEPLLFDSQTDAWAAIAAVPEIAAAAWLGAVSFRDVRANDYKMPETPQRFT